MDRKLAIVGVVMMVVGAYVAGGRQGAGAVDQSTSITIASTATSTADVDEPSARATTTTIAAATVGDDGPPPTATVTTIEPLADSAAIPPTTAWDRRDDTPCDLAFRGYGVAMEPWGDVWLPYTNGWPTSDPGQVPNCAPNTDFGGAVTAAHLAYLDALRPELIDSFAADTAARTLRIETHPGPTDPDSLGYTCAPEGWQIDGNGAYLLFHYCGQSGMKVTRLDLRWADNRWQLVYPTTGRLETWAAPGGSSYYPFESGD